MIAQIFFVCECAFNGMENSFLLRKFGIKSIVIKKVLVKSIIQLNKNDLKDIKFKKSYDLPLDLLQYRGENSAEYLYS